jgi:hypothetical protein
MTRFIWPGAFIILMPLLFSCGEKKNLSAETVDIQSDSIIAEEKMTLILGDVHLIEAALMLERNSGNGVKENPGRYYQGIFDKYRISRERYDANLRYYRQQPERMIKMYDKIIQRFETGQKDTKLAK